MNNKESDPYKVLGVDRNDSNEEIRKKWISLNKEHHPDNLIAKGLPNEFVDQANKELSSINLAYYKTYNFKAGEKEFITKSLPNILLVGVP